MVVNRFNWVEIRVRDLEKAKNFYGSLFDWEISGGENKDWAYWLIDTGEKPCGGMWRKFYYKVYIFPGGLKITMPDVITTVDLVKEYKLGKVVVPALRGINLKLKRGEFVVVLGPSGSGKTTLLNIIGTLDKPTMGKVYVDGKDLASMTEKDLIELRRKKIGFIFQFYNLLAVLTAVENVKLPMIISGFPRRCATKRAEDLLKSVGLENRANHRPDELSGGEQQRVAIARALANSPSIVLADEPTGDLDTVTGQQVMKTLWEMSKREDTTVVVATHNPTVVVMADRILRMRDGCIVADEKWNR